MSEESNNFEFARSHQVFKQRLNSIYEDKYMESSFIPDIQLECDEIIDDWDDLDAKQMYKLYHNRVGVSSLHSLDLQTLVTDMYLDYELPDSLQTDLADKWHKEACQNSYVNSLLEQKSEDYQESTSGTCMDESDDFSLPSGDMSSESSDHSTEDSQNHEYFQENESDIDISRSAGFRDVNNSQFALDGSNLQQSSSLVSPVIQNIFQTDWHGVSFENLRSASPHILESLSPISSQSSSPRFFRSSSPLDDMQELQQSLLMDDSALVLYEDGYIRSHSPLSSGSEHLVPDVDLELQSAVNSLEEIPSFINHAYQRRQNSSQDQVVPEFIAE